MGIRSSNYIALKPRVKLTSAAVQALTLNAVDTLSEPRGTIIVYECNFTPMYARDKFGEHCTFDLEAEIAIQKFLGTLPVESFFMRRVGDQFDYRGNWLKHAFLDDERVRDIEAQYASHVAAAANVDANYSSPAGSEPHGDLLDRSDDTPLLFTRQGRRIRGTVEIAYATGRLCDISRAPNGSLAYDFVENAVVNEGDWETKLDPLQRPFFETEDGKHVAETEVVLVSPSREREFLKAFDR